MWFLTSELRKGKRDQLHRLAQLAGRASENPFVRVTNDVLMKCSPSFRANGSDREKWHRIEGGEPSHQTTYDKT